MASKRIKWSSPMINKMHEFYNKHVAEGRTLDWCHTNFASGNAKAKYTERYHSNKGAYNKYVRGYTRPSQVKPSAPSNTFAPSITLSQILEYKKIAEAAGYKFILT